MLYEFGFQQQFGKIIGMDINLFYKDIRELLALQSIRYNSPNYGPSNYSIYLNKDYGSARGLTLSLTKGMTRFLELVFGLIIHIKNLREILLILELFTLVL